MLNAMNRQFDRNVNPRKLLAVYQQPDVHIRQVKETQLREWARHKISPWIDDNLATFFYFAPPSVQGVEIIAEVTGWHRQGFQLQRMDNLFHLSLQLPKDSRLEYKYLVDGNWYCDPLNSQRADNGIGGENSAFVMPEHRSDPLVVRRENVLHGNIIRQTFKGKVLSGTRNIYIYQPHEYHRSQRRYPVIYVHDGGDYIHRAKLHHVLDNLIADRLIEPVIAVCIDPIDRFHEYTMNRDYCRLLVEEIVPYIDRTFRTEPFPDKRTLLGASLGGLISTFMAYHYAHIFGQVFGQSSSYQFFSERMVDTLLHGKYHPLNLFLTAGRFEGLLGANRRMQAVLNTKGYCYQYEEMNEGHNWTNWSHHLSKGLTYFGGKKQ